MSPSSHKASVHCSPRHADDTISASIPFGSPLTDALIPPIAGLFISVQFAVRTKRLLIYPHSSELLRILGPVARAKGPFSLMAGFSLSVGTRGVYLPAVLDQILGSSGRGKTNLTNTILVARHSIGGSVRFFTASGLLNESVAAQKDWELAKNATRWLKWDSVISDKLGYVPL